LNANLRIIDQKHEIYTPDYVFSVSYVKTTILDLLSVELPKNYRTFLENQKFKKHASDFNLFDANVHILIIVDAVGLDQFKTCFPVISKIHKALGGFTLSSVFPTVTSSVLTSIYTGKHPFEHGIIGHKVYFRELGAILNTLEYTASSGKDLLYKAGVDAKALMWAERLSDYFNDDVKFVELAHSHIINTGLSRFLYENVTCYGYQTITDGFSKLIQIVEKFKDEKTVVSFYIGDFDHLGHVHGPHSWEYNFHASYFEEIFVKTLKMLKDLPNVALSFVSDHGGISLAKVIEFSKSELDKIKELTGVRVGRSGRILHFYLSNGDEEGFIEFTESKINGWGMLVSYKWLKKHHIIGKSLTGDRELKTRIGDYVLIASKNISFRFDSKEKLEMLKPEMGGHGGLTREELLVPYFISPVSEVARLLEV